MPTFFEWSQEFRIIPTRKRMHITSPWGYAAASPPLSSIVPSLKSITLGTPLTGHPSVQGFGRRSSTTCLGERLGMHLGLLSHWGG